MTHTHPQLPDDHGLDLVPLEDKDWSIFDRNDLMDCELVIGLLQSSGIPAVLTGGYRSPMIVKVPLERLAEARQLVAETREAARLAETGNTQLAKERAQAGRTARHGDFVMLALAILAVAYVVYLVLRYYKP